MDVTTSPRWVRLWQGLLDLLFPPRCIGCRRPAEWICSTCLAKVSRVEGPLCSRCGRPLSALSRSMPQASAQSSTRPNRAGRCSACQGQESALAELGAPFYFEGIVRQAVHELKYRGRRVLAEPLGDLLASYVQELSWPAIPIAPVPLHPRRERERGYNQATLLARVLVGRLDWPFLADGLVRWRETRPQVGLERSDRLENVQGAFHWMGADPPPARVLLLDDVCTTGSTMEACAQALLAAGGTEVRGLTLARPR